MKEISFIETADELRHAIDYIFRQQGITAQQLLDKAKNYGIELPRKDNILLGVWTYLDGEIKAKEEYDRAIEDGVTQVTVPFNLGKYGYIHIYCCNRHSLSDKVDLTIYEYQVWQCPRCDTVYALHNMAASIEEEEEIIC